MRPLRAAGRGQSVVVTVGSEDGADPDGALLRGPDSIGEVPAGSPSPPDVAAGALVAVVASDPMTRSS